MSNVKRVPLRDKVSGGGRVRGVVGGLRRRAEHHLEAWCRAAVLRSSAGASALRAEFVFGS